MGMNQSSYQSPEPDHVESVSLGCHHNKREMQRKIVCNEITERLKNFIRDEMNGSHMELVIQKILYMSDLSPNQNRLGLPFSQLTTNNFLTGEENRDLEDKKEIEVQLMGPTLQMYKELMGLKLWKIGCSKSYVLTRNWNHFLADNKNELEPFSKIQVWSFRKDQQLCFALAVVEKPGTIQSD